MKNKESQKKRNIQTILHHITIYSYKFNFSSFPNRTRLILQTHLSEKKIFQPSNSSNPVPHKNKNSPRIIQLAIRHTIRKGDPSSRPDSPSRPNSSCGNTRTRKSVRTPIENLVTLLAGVSYIFGTEAWHGTKRYVVLRKRKIVDNYLRPSSIFRSN